MKSSLPKAPTYQRLTSGTTYTTPSGVKYLKVRMVGGGGGGQGSTTVAHATSWNGVDGTDTTFGTILIAGKGLKGSGVSSTSGYGGGFTINAPAINIASRIGTAGQGGNISGSGWAPSYRGGSTPFGDYPDQANSGAGGGGGPGNGSSCALGGAGGGGGYIEAVVPTPGATYTYAIGGGGAGGAAGTSGYAGSAGAAGFIVVEEFYQ